MNDFLKKIFSDKAVLPSDVCLQSFNNNFTDAINVEWFEKEWGYEVLFYRHNIEHIAIFTLAGALLEYRQNISSEYIPEYIKNTALEKGEIMSSVLKNKGNMLEYELIVRNKQMNRYLLTFSDVGDLIENNLL